MGKRSFSLSRKAVKSGYTDPGSIRDREIADDAAIDGSKIDLADSIVNADIKADAAIDGSKISPNVTNAPVAIVPGYIIAAGLSSVTGAASIVTGLQSVQVCVGTLMENATLAGNLITMERPAAGGTITARVWKPTSATDCTPIVATEYRRVNWIAINTD